MLLYFLCKKKSDRIKNRNFQYNILSNLFMVEKKILSNSLFE